MINHPIYKYELLFTFVHLITLSPQTLVQIFEKNLLINIKIHPCT